MNVSRDLLIALVLIAVVASACNPQGDEEPSRGLNPVAPSAAVNAIQGATPAGAGVVKAIPAPRAMVAPGTCVSGPGLHPLLALLPDARAVGVAQFGVGAQRHAVRALSPNAAWARNGTPFVPGRTTWRTTRSGFKV